ncbi:hypothetical protein PSTG_03396 [Puccinia striiformis f. sp. tritici PST-78]|uniref:OTU domain-containing protein n=1 Tax=Puccinia striiformis f. sp. tritici PST-78 TaxID=1165861 RepID=A0A0L0VWV8_9BASI|nr:hypothetical protein PSTG_03396 [Puccinia striiformis f. sp. tritici PST-78]
MINHSCDVIDVTARFTSNSLESIFIALQSDTNSVSLTCGSPLTRARGGIDIPTKEISQEAEANRSAYLRVLGGEIAMNTIVAGILVAKITDPIPPEKWLNKMDHGQMIANAYGRPVVFLSLESCASFFPTRLGPNDSTSVSDPVYLLHVSGHHWVLADVQDVNGMKPIPPVVGSSRVTSQSTKEWKLKFKQHLTLYNQEVKRVKA